MVIPWITWGESVRRGVALEGVRTMDTAATALWLLGVTLPVPLEGVPVHEAYGAAQAGVPADDGSRRR
jgi:hypothetical protein